MGSEMCIRDSGYSAADASVTVLDLGYPGSPRIRYMNLMPWKWKKGLTDPPSPE